MTELVIPDHVLASMNEPDGDLLDVRPARPLRVVEQSERPSMRFDPAVDGREFVFGALATIEPLWGSGEQTAWAAGEGLMLFGPQGTGKSTLAQQLMKGRLGLLDELLGMPVVPDERRVLYLAMDRPRQAARSMARMFGEDLDVDHGVLEQRLRVWSGPMPYNPVTHPDVLLEMAKHHGAGTIFIDSLKDLAPRLSDDETGSQVNQSIQLCMREGVQVCVLHHPRKASADNADGPKGVDDIYGSTWLTAGLGSILSIHGKPGDPVVGIRQLKLINEEVGPFTVTHDHSAGETSIAGRFDPLVAVQVAGADGATVHDVACAQWSSTPSDAELAKTRRSLDAKVKNGQLTRRDGKAGGAGGGTKTVYFLVPRVSSTAREGAAAKPVPFEAPRKPNRRGTRAIPF